MVDITVQLLGTFAVQTADGSPVRFRSDKVRALLAYLATEAAQPHTRARLAALLWPEQTDDLALRNLSQTLVQLRSALGDDAATEPPLLLISRQTIQWNRANGVRLDLADVARLARSGDTTEREQAVSQYRGEFLQGFSLPGCEAFEEWLLLMREHYQHQVLALLGTLASTYLDAGKYAQAEAAARRHLELDGWHEAAHRQLMRALAQDGQRASALAHYERCRALLLAELGAEPDPATTALYEQIRDGLLAPPNVPAAQRFRVPIPPTPLLGRAEELAQLTQLLAQPSCRLLTLLGPGGVGKTRLALELAAQQQAHFDDGACVVELAAIHDPALVAPTIAQALGMQETDSRTAAERLNGWLRDKQLLLLLDNFEQILSAASLVRDLLGNNLRLKVIVTSRTPLRLRGEQEFAVGPLALPDLRDFGSATVDGIELVAAHAATALFVERARSVTMQFVVTPEHAPIIAAICTRLDGLPLAIELAAARSKLFSPPGLLARLERRLPLLKGDVQDRLPHQQTMRATIAWSEQLLTAPEQVLFARLGVFVGGWTLEMAEEVVALDQDELASLDVLDGIAHLVDHSLVRQHAGNDGEPRFAMLETIREYAVERLLDSNTAAAIHHNHLRSFCALAEAAEPELFAARQRQWFAQLMAELGNLRAALDWALASGAYEPGLRLAGALWWFWLTQGVHQEGRDYLRRLLATAERAEPSLALAKAFAAAGFLEWARADFQAAQPLLETALRQSRMLGQPRIEAWSLTFLGMVATNLGRYARASQLLEESVDLWRPAGDTIGLSWALMFGGDLASAQGDDAGAAAQYQESIALLRALDNNIPLAYPLRQLGHLERRRGNTATAIARWKESLVLTRNVGDIRAIAACLIVLAATVAEAQGERAARLLGAANRALERIAITPLPADRAEEALIIEQIHAQLGETTFRAAWSAGRTMSLQQAIDDALATPHPS